MKINQSVFISIKMTVIVEFRAHVPVISRWREQDEFRWFPAAQVTIEIWNFNAETGPLHLNWLLSVWLLVNRLRESSTRNNSLQLIR